MPSEHQLSHADLVFEHLFDYDGIMTLLTTEDVTSVGAALSCLDSGLDQLIVEAEQGLTALPALELIEFARQFERFRNRMALVDHRIAAALETNDVAAGQCVRSTQRLLAQTLRIGPAEAKRRVVAAAALRPKVTICGERLETRRPVLAAAQSEGMVSASQTHEILACLERLDRLEGLVDSPVDSELMARAEQTLTQHAAVFDPAELRRCADKIVECVHPDGVLADDREQQALRELHLNPRTDGLYNLRGTLTSQVGAALQAVLTPLAVKRPVCPDEGLIIGADDRDRPARLHDALDDAVHRLLKSSSLPTTGGVPATVLITVTDAELTADHGQGRGYGATPDGTLVPVRRLSWWADEAETITVRTTSTGEVLELGRHKRIASKNQTLALIARDQACTLPGCEHPPQWCDRHHVVEWQAGGDTDIGNLTLLCRYHHRRFETHGWSCQMISGLPHWIPPRWVDRNRRPILNQRLARRYQTASLIDPARAPDSKDGIPLPSPEVQHATAPKLVSAESP